MAPSSARRERERVARPVEYGELPAAAGFLGVWLVGLLTANARTALELAWLLIAGLLLGGWTLLVRLRWSDERLRVTAGPWRRHVTLGELASVAWRRSGGPRSRGIIEVRDRAGHRVRIYVGRFGEVAAWGPALLAAAQRSGATVDEPSRRLLAATGPDARGRRMRRGRGPQRPSSPAGP